jgi:hypothetical protein
VKKILVVAFMLAGCGGESFSGSAVLDPAATDAADGGGLGGAPAEVDAGGDTGGNVGTGGASSGGTASSGGASTGGVPVSTGGSSSGGANTGGSSGSTGGVTNTFCCKYQTGVPGLVSPCGGPTEWVCDSSGTTSKCAQCVVGVVCHPPSVPGYWGIVEACP